MMQRGLTMIETLIVIAFFVVLSAVLVEMYISYSRFFGAHDSYLDAIGGADLVLSEVSSAVLQANAVLPSHTFASGSHVTDADTLVLQLPSISASGDVISGSYDYAVIYATSTYVYRLLETSGASARLAGSLTLTNTLDSLAFTYNASSSADITSVRAAVRTEKVLRDRTVGASLEQLVYLRNK